MDEIIIVEEYLFFNQYKFHKQKIILHRASMKYYEDYLLQQGLKTNYVDAQQKESNVSVLINEKLKTEKVVLHYYQLFDNWLEKKITKSCKNSYITVMVHDSEYFINTFEEFNNYFTGKKKYFQSDFYIHQRKRLNILMQPNGKPMGDKWSFDADNRLKYPKEKKAPKVKFPAMNKYYKEAILYVEQPYANNYGIISRDIVYPTTHAESKNWLEQFLANRFSEFGEYEDAIVSDQSVLHHSVLTPMLNIGLLTPIQVVKTTLAFAERNAIPLNSLTKI